MEPDKPEQGNPRQFSHCMVDLETLGTRPGCAILSIGAVAFDPNARTFGPQFYTVISHASCQAAGLHQDRGTLAWWRRQSPEAQQVMRDANAPDARPLANALDEFSTFIGQLAPQCRVWGCGSDFDNAILAHCYAITGKRLPWKYTNNRCYRTLKNLLPLVTIERAGTHHNALDDAIYQAQHATAILTALRKALYR